MDYHHLASAPGGPPPPLTASQLSALLGGLRIADLRAILKAVTTHQPATALRKSELVERVADLVEVRAGQGPVFREAAGEREKAERRESAQATPGPRGALSALRFLAPPAPPSLHLIYLKSPHAARLVHAAHALKARAPDPYGGMAAAILADAAGYPSVAAYFHAERLGPPHWTLAAAAGPPGPGPGPPSAARAAPPGPGPGEPAAHYLLPPSAAAASAASARAASAGGRAPGGDGGGGPPPAAPRPPPLPANTRIRCLCGDHTDRRTPMIQCGVPGCGVWQHGACVLPAGAPLGGQGDPPFFACEACRLVDADPFWAPAAASDCPGLAGCTAYDAARLAWRASPAFLPAGADPGSGVVAADRAVTLSAAALAALAAHPDRLRLQLACVGLGDGPAWPGATTGGYGGGPGPGAGGVPGRVHWPRFCDARLNNTATPPPHRRHPHDPLTSRSRDGPIDVPPALLRVGANRVYVGGIEPPGRAFALIARIVAARPLAALVAAPPAPEPLPAALARVAACVAGDDPDLVVESAPLSLRCPLSGARFARPVRLAGPGGGLVAFDWAPFLEVGAASRRWVCPHSLRPAPLRSLVGDGFIGAVLGALGEAGRGVMEVEVRTDGRWRAGAGGAWRSILLEDGSVGEEGGELACASASAATAAAPAPGGRAATPTVVAAPASPAAQAPAAVKAEAPPALARGGSGRAGARAPPPPADTILISSGSDEEEDVPLAARGAARGAPTRRQGSAGGLAGGAPAAAAAAAAPAPPAPAPAAHPTPIRVSLPTRSRPAVDAAAAAAAVAAEARAREGVAMQRLLGSFVEALTAAASPDRGATVAAAAAQLVASGTASPTRATAMAGRAFDAAAQTLRARGGGGGGGRPASAATPPAERAAATAAAAAARVRLATDSAARARVTAMAVGAAAARLPSGGGGEG